LNHITPVETMWDAADEREQVEAEWGGARSRMSIIGQALFSAVFSGMWL
jgi:hypothetical protein